MERNQFLGESIVCLIIKVIGFIVRRLPLGAACAFGRFLGYLRYLLDGKKRRLVYSNLKQGFAHEKTPSELRKICRKVFETFGQNGIDLMRMPLMTKENYQKVAYFDRPEYAEEALSKGNGLIMLAMHFGNWELASLSAGFFGSSLPCFGKSV